jgi:hypothetical protein
MQRGCKKPSAVPPPHALLLLPQPRVCSGNARTRAGSAAAAAAAAAVAAAAAAVDVAADGDGDRGDWRR